MLWAAIEYVFGGLPIGETLDFLPALYLLFVVCLVWSSLASCVLYLVDGDSRVAAIEPASDGADRRGNPVPAG